MREAVEIADRIRALNGTTLDDAGHAAHVARLLGETELPAPAEGTIRAAPRALVLGPELRWVASPRGPQQRVGSALRRILEGLVQRHEERPGEALGVWELCELGWPGEQPVYEAGANRVYVALNRLRNLGLRELIERHDGGYRLAPDTVVTRSDAKM
jgi:hypothetical protein